MAVHLVVAGDVFDGVLFCAVHFPHEMSSMRSGTELSQFLRIFLPTLQTFNENCSRICCLKPYTVKGRDIFFNYTCSQLFYNIVMSLPISLDENTSYITGLRHPVRKNI